ncbi:MAG: phosphatase PAP2 family protein, partial [Betaproteobacteria bacterium]
VLARQYPEYRVLFYAGATLVAISRVYERAHWPSDTLVGAVVGVWSANQVMGRSRLFEVTW